MPFFMSSWPGHLLVLDQNKSVGTMDKASKVLRRSSVRLRSMGSGHRELNLVISELKEMRATAKAFLTSQQTASLELLRWAQADENRAVQDTFVLLNELSALWTDVQKDFADHLKEFRTQFELILEGEKLVDQARNAVAICDQRETRLRKDLKKTIKKGTAEEMQDMEKRLYEAVRTKEVAQLEVEDRARENEAVKLIRVKESLLKVSESYLELANKCRVIFEAHRDVAYQLPDVHGKDLQDVKYTGHEASKRAVQRAKENVSTYRRRSHNLMPCAPQPEDPPPPYSVSPPFNPSYGFVPPYAMPQASYYAGPSTSYDVPDGLSHTNNQDAGSSSSATNATAEAAASNWTSNIQPRRRGFFFRSSRRRSSACTERPDENRNDAPRPRSSYGPIRSTNPFDENYDHRSPSQPSTSQEHSQQRPSSGGDDDLSGAMSRAGVN